MRHNAVELTVKVYMKRFFLLLFIVYLQGCVGVSVGTFGTETAETKTPSPKSLDYKASFPITQKYFTKQDFIDALGEPDNESYYKNCEVITYYNGFSWSGLTAYLLIVPIPLFLPSGIDESSVYFRGGYATALTQEYGTEKQTYGYICGELGCKTINGYVHSFTGIPKQKPIIELEGCD